jgi:hypothetical protein
VIDRVPAVVAPETGLRRGQVRVSDHNGREDVREVLLGEAVDAWNAWAHQTRFALQNTQFIDIGDTIYRCETIDRIEPITTGQSASDEALQACMGILVVIRDGVLEGDAQVRYMCQRLLATLEERGFVLHADQDAQSPLRQT